MPGPIQYLILPGWQNSGPDHWQSLWEAELSSKSKSQSQGQSHGQADGQGSCQGTVQRVVQHDWMRPLRGDWITRLEDQILLISEHSAQQARGLDAEIASKNSHASIVLIAHSLGCHLVAAWAALSRQTHRVRGALLVAPPDAQREDFPADLKSWRSPVLQKLPFKSICVVSSDDPFCCLLPGRDMAAAWGSQLFEIGNKGHINAGSGLGHWPQGRALLARLAT